MIFLDDDDTRRFVVPFNNEGEEEGEGEYEYSNLVVVVVVILLVVKLVVIVPQKARVIKTFCVCVFLCVCVEDKSVLFFPPFAKSRTDGRQRKFSFAIGKKIEEKLAHAFLHLFYKTLFFKSTNNNNV
jgi:hypothetical protein